MEQQVTNCTGKDDARSTTTINESAYLSSMPQIFHHSDFRTFLNTATHFTQSNNDIVFSPSDCTHSFPANFWVEEIDHPQDNVLEIEIPYNDTSRVCFISIRQGEEINELFPQLQNLHTQSTQILKDNDFTPSQSKKKGIQKRAQTHQEKNQELTVDDYCFFGSSPTTSGQMFWQVPSLQQSY